VDRFLNESSAPYAWFVEEDVVVPKDALQELLALNVDIAAINYQLKVGRISESRWNGTLEATSLGCTLIRRVVFETVSPPWFRVDQETVRVHPGSASGHHLELRSRLSSAYGGHDNAFCFRALEAGFSIATVPGMLCKHLQLVQLSEFRKNDGRHLITEV